MLALLLCGFTVACDPGGTSTEVSSVELSLVPVAASDSQRTAVATTLPALIAVRVVDQNQRPVASVPVSWAVLTGGGSVGASSSSTDSTGTATVSWLLGTTAGAQLMTATLLNGKVDTLMAVALPGEVQSLAVASEPFITVPAGVVFGPLQVRALDRFGNAVAGATVQWTTSAGQLGASSTVTAADGVAQVALQTVTGPQDHVVRASIGGFSAEIVVRGQ